MSEFLNMTQLFVKILKASDDVLKNSTVFFFIILIGVLKWKLLLINSYKKDVKSCQKVIKNLSSGYSAACNKCCNFLY